MGCKAQYIFKYLDRNTPPSDASDCLGMVRSGNNGKPYIARKMKNGKSRWFPWKGDEKHQEAAAEIELAKKPEMVKMAPKQQTQKQQKTSRFSTRFEACTSPNFRPYNEDRSLYIKTESFEIACVVDGHGGQECATFLEKKLCSTLATELLAVSSTEYSKIIPAVIHRLGEKFRATNQSSGAMLSGIVVTSRKGILFNLGDSKTVVYDLNRRSRLDPPVFSTSILDVNDEDHVKEFESRRGCRAKCHRSNLGTRCLGEKSSVNFLATFGDYFDESITGCFDRTVEVMEFDLKDGYVIIGATDGLWDNVTTEINAALPTKSIVEQVLNKPSNGDNITVFKLSVHPSLLDEHAIAKG